MGLDSILGNEFEKRCRAAVEAARRTGKPQISSTGEISGFPFVERVHLVNYAPERVPKSRAYWAEWEGAETRLHAIICNPRDWQRIDEFYSTFPPDDVRSGRVRWANVAPGQKWKVHSSEDCEAPRWRFVEKGRSELVHQFARAAGIMGADLGLPWDGALLVTESCRRNRRGRPALKHPFYDVATAYALSAREACGQLPRGFFQDLARYLSMPWFFLEFSSNELKKATCEIEVELQTAEGVVRNEYSARTQWGDDVMIAVLHTHLPPHKAALITPAYRALARSDKPARIS